MRLFVALDLPAGVRARLAAWAQAATPAHVRRVSGDNLHLTLAFLGARGSDDATAVRTLLPGLARALPRLRTAGALWLPARRPGVLTVAVQDEPALTQLRADLVAGLVAGIGFEPEARRFRPHVTVGRVARGTRIDTREALEPPPPALGFQAHRLTLYRSRTTPDGARYDRMGAVELR
jgi:2'-5' RNA ligase